MDEDNLKMRDRVPVSVRVSASVLDWVIVAALFHLCGWIAGDLDREVSMSLAGNWAIGMNGPGIGWIVALAYFSTEAPLRQTVGKMFFRIIVASRTSEQLTISRRLIRYVIKNLCVMGTVAATVLPLVPTALNASAWYESLTWLVTATGLLLAAISLVLIALKRPAVHDLFAQTEVLEQSSPARGFPVG